MRANCIICSDLFDETNPISAAKCGHVYHSSCLTLWLDQSKSCPHCRARITVKDVHKLYFNFPPKHDLNTSELENEIVNLKSQLSEKTAEIVACKKDKQDLVVFVRDAENRCFQLQQAVHKAESEVTELRLSAKTASRLEAKVLKLEQMNVALTNDLEHLNNVKTIVNGTQKDVEDILKNYADRSEAVKQLATYCTCLKRELQKLIDSKNKLIELNSRLKKENCSFASKIKFFEEAMAISNNGGSKLPHTSTPAKKLIISDENNSLAANALPCSSYQTTEVDVSPLTVNFKQTKFNMCIKSTGAVFKSNPEEKLPMKNSVVASMQCNVPDTDSIIRIGYNGLGGHSNFITSRIKKSNSLKRKM